MARSKRAAARKAPSVSARGQSAKIKRIVNGKAPSAATLDPHNLVAVEAFTKNLVRAAKLATAKAVADLHAAGIPVAVSDGNGGVLLKRSTEGRAPKALPSRRRA